MTFQYRHLLHISGLALAATFLVGRAAPAQEARATPVFSTIAADERAFHGFLERGLTQELPEARPDERIADLRGRVAKLERDGTPTELKQAVALWEAIIGAPVVTPSGRPGLKDDALWVHSPGSVRPLASPDWLESTAGLLHLTGQSRFADALEAALYSSAFANPAPKTQRNMPNAPAIAAENILLRFREGDTENIALSLFETTASNLRLEGQNVRVSVLSGFPHDGNVQVQFRTSAPVRFAFWVRVPAWVPQLTVRSAAAGTEWVGLAGDWMRLPARTWSSGEFLEISFPMQVRSFRKPTPQELGTKPGDNSTRASRDKERNRVREPEYQWGPIIVKKDPAHDRLVSDRLDSGTGIALTLENRVFQAPGPPRRTPPNRPRPEQPGKQIPAREIVYPGSSGPGRGWWIWRRWDPKTWEAEITTDPPGESWTTKVLPWATTVRYLTYGARPDELLPGERVNLFLAPSEDREWGWVAHFQDELTQMQGHNHWWFIRSVDRDERSFKARVYMAGENYMSLPEITFEVDPRGEAWVEGKRVDRYPLKAGERVRMTSVLQDDRRIAMLLTDDASLDALKARQQAEEARRVAAEGMAGQVEGITADTARLLLFANEWPYAGKLKAGQKVRIRLTGEGYRPTGEAIEGAVVNAKVGGPYGSGPTDLSVKVARPADQDLLREWGDTHKVVRVIPASG